MSDFEPAADPGSPGDPSDDGLGHANSNRRFAFYFVQLSFGLVGTTVFAALYQTSRSVYWMFASAGYPAIWSAALGRGASGSELARLDRLCMVLTLCALWLLSFLGIQILEEHSDRESYPPLAILTDLTIAVLFFLAASSVQSPEFAFRTTDSAAWLALVLAICLLYLRLLTGPTVFRIQKPGSIRKLQDRSRASVFLIRSVVMLALLGPIVALRQRVNVFSTDHAEWIKAAHLAGLSALALLFAACMVVAFRIRADQEIDRVALGSRSVSTGGHEDARGGPLLCWQIVWRRVRGGIFFSAAVCVIVLGLASVFRAETLRTLEEHMLTVPISPICVLLAVVGGMWSSFGASPESSQNEVLLPSFSSSETIKSRKALRRLELDLHELWAIDACAYYVELDFMMGKTKKGSPCVDRIRTRIVRRRFLNRPLEYFRSLEGLLLWARPRRRKQEALLLSRPDEFLARLIQGRPDRPEPDSSSAPQPQQSTAPLWTVIDLIEADQHSDTDRLPNSQDPRTWARIDRPMAIAITCLDTDLPEELWDLRPKHIAKAQVYPPESPEARTGPDSRWTRIRSQVVIAAEHHLEDFLLVAEGRAFAQFLDYHSGNIRPAETGLQDVLGDTDRAPTPSGRESD